MSEPSTKRPPRATRPDSSPDLLPAYHTPTSILMAAMRFDIITLFPEMLAGPFDASIIGRARASGAIEIAVHNPRDYASDKHHVTDDYAFGGGPGMVMKPEPLFECVDAVRASAQPSGKVVLLTPQGRLLDQRVVDELAHE